MLVPAVLALLWLTAAGYADTGGRVCAKCHPAIYKSYMQTGMARSSGRMPSAAFRENFGKAAFAHDRAGVHYRVERQREETFFEFDLPGVHGRRNLEYFIGSGAVGRSYLYSLNGFLYQAPVSFYSADARWGISPGFQSYDRLVLTRPVRPACLQCHASALQPVAGTDNGFASPAFQEAGIGCERCHGPGDRHIQGVRSAIVNPAKLTPERRDSICAQCHLDGEARIPRGAHENSFRPGDRLSDHIVVFVSDGETGMKVTSHFAKLAASACKRGAGDTLWCGTCHSPHGAPIDVRARCAACHRQRTCAQGEDCVACHMPKSPVRDVEHTVYTDHSIPRRSGIGQANRKGQVKLIPFGKVPVSTRELGLAYAAVSGFEPRARNLLRAAVRHDPDDVRVLVALAYAYDLNGEEERAIPLYERALQLDPSQVSAAVNLGGALMNRGRLQAAIRLWRDALSRSPGLEVPRLNLAAALLRSGDRAGAREALTELLRLNPGNLMGRRLLLDIH